MRNHHSALLMLGCSLAALGAGSPAAAQAAAEAQAATVNELVVTASKRAQRLQDVPAAITALQGNTLEKIGVQEFHDYASLVPGLSFRDGGSPGTGTVILRGLYTGPQQLTNTTATYLDDTPFTASGFLSAGSLLTPDPDVNDLDRIEVLKGPQGTLYGANSLGGLIRIVSRQPSLTKAGGFITLEGSSIDGGGAGYSAHLSGNAPIIDDTLAVRLNGVYRKAPGWVENVGTGSRNLNSSVIAGGRLAIRYAPTTRLTLDLTGVIQDIRSDGVAQQDDVTGTLTPLYGRNKYSAPLDLGSHLRYEIVSGSADYDLGPASLVGSLSYGEYSTRILSDYTTSYVAYARSLSPALAGIIPSDAAGVGDFSPNMDKLTAEVRLVTKRIGAFEFVAGGFYTSEHNRYRSIISLARPDGSPLAAPYDVLVRANTLSDYKEWAAFVNGTYYFTDSLSFTGGIRYAINRQEAETGGPGAVTFFAPRATADFSFKDNVATYLATFTWKPTSALTAYVRAASGYRPGGPQTNPAPPAGAQTRIDPDSVWNYEGGVKATLFDGRVSANASGYHIDWSRIQLNTLYNGVVLQANGGDAKVDGFEVELTAQPARNLTVSVNGGYTNARLSSVLPGVTTAVGATAGDQLPLTPKWTAAAIADRTFDLGGGMNLDLGGTLRYRADMPASFPGSALNPNIAIPSLTTLDLRAGVNLDRYSFQARIENVTDSDGLNSYSTSKIAATQAVPSAAVVIRPRTFTLAVTARF